MFEVSLLNLQNGKKFYMSFESEYLLNRFLNKVKYSKTLKLCSVSRG